MVGPDDAGPSTDAVVGPDDTGPSSDAADARDARPAFVDSAYVPRDSGPIDDEPCRGTTRRLTIVGDDIGFGELVGRGDRVASLDALTGPRVFDLVAGVELGPIDPAPGFEHLVAHDAGFDLVQWSDAAMRVRHLDRDGRTLGEDAFPRATTDPASLLTRGIVRVGDGYLVLTQVSEPAELRVEQLSASGSRVLAVGTGSASDAALALAGATRLVGSVVVYAAGGVEHRRFEIDLAAWSATSEVVGALPRWHPGFGQTALGIDGDVALAAYAETALGGDPSAVQLAWWTVGGAELARTRLESVSVDGVGIVGIAGAMPEQAMVLSTGQRSARASLLAGLIRAPGEIEGGSSPLVVGVDLRYGTVWEWIEGGIAIAFAGSGRMEVILACGAEG